MMRIIMHYRPRGYCSLVNLSAPYPEHTTYIIEILQTSGLLAPLTQTEEVLRRKRALSGAGTRQEEPIVIKDEDEEDDDEPIQVNADGVEIRKPKVCWIRKACNECCLCLVLVVTGYKEGC
jgi:hypothetical protein